MSKELKEVKDQLPSVDVTELEELAGAGDEQVTSDDITLPNLLLLQPLSPQLGKRNSKYIPGASAGDLINSLTTENYGQEVDIVPVYYYRSYVEYIPRNADGSGGGFIAEHLSYDTSTLKPDPDTGRPRFNDEGNEIIDTGNHLIMIIQDDQPPYPVMLRCQSTKWRAARKLNSLIRLPSRTLAGGNGSRFTPPRFSMVFNLLSVEVDGTPAYWTLDVFDEKKWATKEQFEAGLSLYDAFTSGKVKVAEDESEQ